MEDDRVGARRRHKLEAAIGLLLAGNGLLLLLTPARFATLRKVGWLPSRYNAALDQLARRPQLGRSLGFVATGIGAGVLARAVRDTEPAA